MLLKTKYNLLAQACIHTRPCIIEQDTHKHKHTHTDKSTQRYTNTPTRTNQQRERERERERDSIVVNLIHRNIQIGACGGEVIWPWEKEEDGCREKVIWTWEEEEKEEEVGNFWREWRAETEKNQIKGKRQIDNGQ